MKVPRIDAGVATDSIMMYYNNTAASDAQDAANVWDANHKAVWHLHDDFVDATSNPNDATNFGSTDIAGNIGDGQDFDGTNDYVDVPDSASLDVGPDFTVDLWFSPSANFDANSDYLQGLLDKGSYQLFLDKSDGKLKAEVNDGSTTWSTSYNSSYDKIFDLAVYDGKLYVGQGGDAARGKWPGDPGGNAS